MNLQELKNDKSVLYLYVRGSKSQGISTPKSDTDIGGIYYCSPLDLLGLNLDYKRERSDEKHDTCLYELTNFARLLLKSNPSVLESLFVDDEFIIKSSNIMNSLRKNRDLFLTKQCFAPFAGYAISQIKKARGLNKKIVNPIEKRLWPLDFCYTNFECASFDNNNGSVPIKSLLKHYGLKQEYCGLQSINNMPGCYNVFYDIERHLQDELEAFYKENEKTDIVGNFIIHYNEKEKSYKGNYNDSLGFKEAICDKFLNSSLYKVYLLVNKSTDEYIDKILKKVPLKPIGYRGIVGEDGKSDTIRCSSIPEGEKPLCMLCYNLNAFQHHCVEYKNYRKWVKERNPVRYESNLDKNYDSKNMSHCFRLLQCAIEIANGKGFIVNRKGIDSDFLLNIRNHEYSYDYLMKELEYKNTEMLEAEKNSKLPECIDKSILDNILVYFRLQQIKNINKDVFE